MTRWHTGGPQDPTNEITIDLGAVEAGDAASSSRSAGYVADFPRVLTIDTSADGASWTPAWSGRTALFERSRRRSRSRWNCRCGFPFEPRPARFVRLRQTGPSGIDTTGVAELRSLSGVASRTSDDGQGLLLSSALRERRISHDLPVSCLDRLMVSVTFRRLLKRIAVLAPCLDARARPIRRFRTAPIADFCQQPAFHRGQEIVGRERGFGLERRNRRQGGVGPADLRQCDGTVQGHDG